MTEHPVRFDPVVGADGISTCVVCGALVARSTYWEEVHRKNHDQHNEIHNDLERQARSYVMPPRYG